jgi:uncharacterized membrane protein
VANEYNLNGIMKMAAIKLFFSLLVACFLLDMTWLGFIAKKIYGDALGNILRKTDGVLTPNWPAAVIVYIAIVIGIMVFVLPKAQNNLLIALLWGGIFGAVCYGIYDFTNYSIIQNWPLNITLIDFAWGIFLCSIVTVIGAYLQTKFS